MRKKRRKLGDKGLVTRMIIYIVRQKVLHQIKSEEYNLCNDFLDRKCYNSNEKVAIKCNILNVLTKLSYIPARGEKVRVTCVCAYKTLDPDKI